MSPLLLLALLATAPPTPPAARLEVALAPGEVTVGDPVEATLTLTLAGGPPAGEPRFPAWGDTWGEVEVLGVEPVERVPGGAVETLRQRVHLAAYRPGRLPLAPVEVAVPGAGGTLRLSTPADLALTVRSLLPEQGEVEPRPATPPRPLPLGRAFWLTAGALAIASTLLALLFLRRRRDLAAARPLPAVDPFAALAAALERLDPGAGAERFHTALSLALRHCLERSLRFPAAESTTSEITRELLARHLPHDLPRRAADLLRACDLVKFARSPASTTEAEERRRLAAAIGGDLAAHLRPAPPAVEEATR